MYRYLFFDADGTLFDFNEAETRAFYQMAENMGFRATAEQLLTYKTCNEACWSAFERFEITQATLTVKRFEDFFAAEKLYYDPHLASRTFEQALSLQGVLYEGSLPLLEALTERGYTLYLATNGIAEVQRGRLKHSGTEKYFTDIFISEELGSQKPDKLFFSRMLQRAGLESRKKECLMIGDRLTSDILGGLLSGMDTLWLTMEGKTNDTAILPTHEAVSLSKILDLLESLC